MISSLMMGLEDVDVGYGDLFSGVDGSGGVCGVD